MADTSKTTEVMTCITVETKDKVNEIVDKAVAAGAAENSKTEEFPSMYYRSFCDPDGHIWEIMWMVPESEQNPGNTAK
ncbi:MAG TPA: hypothetical protein PKA39_14805 [Ignavibacteria bacterium]|nr:hypothetical protein [Ignavibacteria bacterium]